MKHREGTGSLKCRMCDASFQMPIHHLHEPIDVFSEWLDECEAAEKRSNGILDASTNANVGGTGMTTGIGSAGVGGGMRNNSNAARQGYEYDSEEDDDDLGESSGLGAKRNNQQQQHSRNSLGLGDSDDDSD